MPDQPNIVVFWWDDLTFVEYPPRMKAASVTIDQVQEKPEAAIASGR